MTLLCVGVSHESAPLAVRERLARSGDALPQSLRHYLDHRSNGLSSIAELAVLSTCNRVEIYAVGRAGFSEVEQCDAVREFLAGDSDVDRADLDAVVRERAGAEAAIHLCRVASGLESTVIGECEVLGQVASARREAERHGTSGPVLETLFRTAVRAGRRARAETAIGREGASVASIAARLAAELVAEAGGGGVLVLGAGRMGSQAAAMLRARGISDVSVVGTRGLDRTSLVDQLSAADAVICCSAAPGALVDAADVISAQSRRGGRPIVFLDIAVPRDVDASVRAVDGVRVIDLDDLQLRAATALAGRAQEIPRVETIALEEAERFIGWHRGIAVEEVVVDLRQRAETMRLREVERTLRDAPELDAESRARLERLSKSLVNKLLHEPTRRLRLAAARGDGAQVASLTRQLFALPPALPDDTASAAAAE